LSRFYDITIGASPSGSQGAVFTNQVQGKADPGAPQVELDIPVTTFAVPLGYAYVKVWGIGLRTISQAANFNGAPITVKAGMQPGLPLASAQAPQAGIVLQGLVQQAYGNWQGVNQTLDLVVQTDGGASQGNPRNIVLVWKKGTPLADALTATLQTAYPEYKLNINVSSSLVLTQDEAGYFQTIEQLAQYVKNASTAILNASGSGTYAGVDISINNGVFNVFDGSTPTSPRQLAAQDFIGQITWLGANVAQFTTVMRADLSPGDFVKFPDALSLQTQTTPQSQAFARTSTTFSGAWNIGQARHVGNSRGADANSWVSVFQAYTAGAANLSDPDNVSS
jgi:hypothetical protein